MGQNQGKERRTRATSDADSDNQELSPPLTKRRRLPARIYIQIESDDDDDVAVDESRLSDIERLPNELLLLIMRYIARPSLLVPLAGASRTMRKKLHPLVMEQVTFACQWHQLVAPGMKKFRRGLVNLHLKRPRALLYEDDEDKQERGSSTTRSQRSEPLLPKLRTLVLQSVTQLKSNESANITVPAFSVIAPHVARQAPNLQRIISDIDTSGSLSAPTIALVSKAWKVTTADKTGRQGAKGKGEGREKLASTPPVSFSAIEVLAIDMPTNHTTLRSRALSLFFNSLKPLRSLRRLELNLAFISEATFQCSEGVADRSMQEVQSPCVLERLAEHISLLRTLKELKIQYTMTMAPLNYEPCLMTYLSLEGLLGRLRKLEITARLRTLEDMELMVGPSHFSQLRELHFLLYLTKCPEATGLPHPSRALSMPSLWLILLYQNLPLLELVRLHVEEDHVCNTVLTSGGSQACPVHGRTFHRSDFLRH